MKILFICGLFPKDKIPLIIQKSTREVQFAANNLQERISHGFREKIGDNFYILSAPIVNSFPNGYKDIYIKKFEGTENCKYVPFVNIWGLRNLSRKHALIKEINNFISIKDDEKYIIVYSPHVPFLQAAVYAKEMDPSIKINLILPDLPQYVNLAQNVSLIYKMFKLIDLKNFYTLTKKIDNFVFLTEHMNKVVNLENKPYAVIEGIVSTNDIHEFDTSENKSDNKTVIYTGTLNYQYGIRNLLEAFHNIQRSNISLVICGKGEAEEEIYRFCDIDKRIRYLGQISGDECRKCQLEADILVNPRQNIGEYTKYSFPSKNLEYLSTGKPVIAYKLDGIPDKYDNFFFYVEDNSIESLSQKIEQTMDLSKEFLIQHKQKVLKFLLDNKNEKVSTDIILSLFKNN